MVPLPWVTCMHSHLAPGPSTQQRLPSQPLGTLPHFMFDTPTLCASPHYRDFSFSSLVSCVSQCSCSGGKSSREVRVDGEKKGQQEIGIKGRGGKEDKNTLFFLKLVRR